MYLNTDMHQSLFNLCPELKGNKAYPIQHIGIVHVGINSLPLVSLLKKTEVLRRIEVGEIYYRSNQKVIETD